MLRSILVSLYYFLTVATLASSTTNCPPTKLCYAIDESGSISHSDFVKLTSAVVSITSNFSQLSPGSSFSAVGFSSSAHVIFTLTPDESAAIGALQNNPKSGGGTSLGSGLNACYNILKNENDPRIILLFTDGIDGGNPSGTTVQAAIKANGIVIATVGIGRNVNKNDLKNVIASDPTLYTAVARFSSLQTKIVEIVNKLCPATPTPTSTTTPTPSSTSSTSPTPSTSPPPKCAPVNCAKCGQVLECYVQTGFDQLDAAICDLIETESFFCAEGRGKLTKCKQQCAQKQGTVCYPGQSWATCPAIIGSPHGTASCKGGAGRGNSAALSNFASYEVCINDEITSNRCLIDKCDSGSCPCA